MPSPFFRASTIESKMQFTMSSALPFGSLVRSETASMSSDFVIKSLPVGMGSENMLLKPFLQINLFFQLLLCGVQRGGQGLVALVAPFVSLYEDVLVAVVACVEIDDVVPG